MKKFTLIFALLFYCLIISHTQPAATERMLHDSGNNPGNADILQDVVFLQTLNPNSALNTAEGHLSRAQEFANKALYPRSANDDGTIKRVSPADWTSGFFPGSLWLMYENTKDEIWRTRAEQWTAALEGQKFRTSDHDVGLIINLSFGAGYRLTGNENYKAILLQGAKSLATRFNPAVGCIKSWTRPEYTFPVIIDNMVTLEILFAATRISGDSSYYKIAVTHALTTIANHFRADNSSYHLVDYNANDGSVISKVTVQGLNNLSDWARGQAWGLYGYTMCYRETGDVRFLDMAKKIAEFYTTHSNMPSDLVPYWDFDAFDNRDASAGCIAGSALLELSQFVPEKRNTYYNFGINTLKAVSSTAYMAPVGTNNDFILKHSVGNQPKNREVDKPANYADYYFIEALLRHKKPAPTLTAAGGNNQISLKWNTSTGATYYSIRRSSKRKGSYETIVSNTTNTNYINSGLSSGKTYYYKVTSWNAVGEGYTSVEATATTNNSQVPSNPTSFKASNISYTSVNLSWTASTDNVGVTGYDVYRGTAVVGSTASLNFTVTGLTHNTTYSFTVRAKDASGNVSGNSNKVTITTLQDTQAPGAPTTLTASNVTATSVNLSWTRSTDNVGVAGYDIYRGTTNIGTSTITSFKVTGLTTNTAYSFKVQAKDRAGNKSANSNTVNVTTLNVSQETLLTANNAGGDKVEVNKGQDGAQSFRYGTSGTYRVTKVVLYLSKDPQGLTHNLAFSIGTSINGNTVSGSSVSITPGSVTNTSEGKTYQTFNVIFSTPVTLQSGKTYYLNFSNNDASGKKYYLEYDPKNNYAKGTYFKSHSNDGKDMRFKIYGNTTTASGIASDNYKVTSWNAVGEGYTSVEASATTNAASTVSMTTPAYNESFTESTKTNIENGNAKIVSPVSLSLKIVPAPAKNTLNIYTAGFEQSKKLTIAVVSVSGIVVKTVHAISNQKIQMDISSLRSGAYFLKVLSGDKILYSKFVKL